MLNWFSVSDSPAWPHTDRLLSWGRDYGDWRFMRSAMPSGLSAMYRMSLLSHREVTKICSGSIYGQIV